MLVWEGERKEVGEKRGLLCPLLALEYNSFLMSSRPHWCSTSLHYTRQGTSRGDSQLSDPCCTPAQKHTKDQDIHVNTCTTECTVNDFHSLKVEDPQNRILALLALTTQSFCGSVDICDTIHCEDAHTVHYSQFSLDDMCKQNVHVCVLPHLAENIDGFVLIEEPHDDTNILLLKSKIEVQQYNSTYNSSSYLPPLLPSSPHPFLPDISFPSFQLPLFPLPNQPSLPLSSLLFSSLCAPPIPLSSTNSPYLNLSQWDLGIICETSGDQFLLLIILTTVGGVVESVVLGAKLFHRLVMRVCKYKLFV